MNAGTRRSNFGKSGTSAEAHNGNLRIRRPFPRLAAVLRGARVSRKPCTTVQCSAPKHGGTADCRHPSGGDRHAERSAPAAAGSCGDVGTGIKYNRDIVQNSGISACTISSFRLCLILRSSLFYLHSCRDKREIPLKGKGICNIGGRRARRYCECGNTVLPQQTDAGAAKATSGLLIGGVIFLRTQSYFSTELE